MKERMEILGGKFLHDGVELKLRCRSSGDIAVVSIHIDDLTKISEESLESQLSDPALLLRKEGA